jgi:hypothetical protein
MKAWGTLPSFRWSDTFSKMILLMERNVEAVRTYVLLYIKWGCKSRAFLLRSYLGKLNSDEADAQVIQSDAAPGEIFEAVLNFISVARFNVLAS